MAAAELFVLNLIALVTVIVCSRLAGLSYPLAHGLTYNGLLFAGGIVFLAGSLCLSEFVEGEYTPALAGLGSVGLLYFVMQPYADGLAVTGLATPVALPKVMAGLSDISRLRDIQWLGMLASLATAVGFAALGQYRSHTRDY